MVLNGDHDIVSRKSLLKSHEYVVFEKNCLVLLELVYSSKLNFDDGTRVRVDLRVGKGGI